jgi:hypothetical protein
MVVAPVLPVVAHFIAMILPVIAKIVAAISPVFADLVPVPFGTFARPLSTIAQSILPTAETVLKLVAPLAGWQLSCRASTVTKSGQRSCPISAVRQTRTDCDTGPERWQR